MKRLSFFLVLCFLGLSNLLNAQVTISIGSGDANCSFLPIDESFKFSISQQIYTAEELNVASGSITAIAFKSANDAYVNRTIRVYMINTDKESFAHTQDWVNLTNDDKYFEGVILYPGVAGEWMKIDLQTAFQYTGGNILVCLHDISAQFSESDAKFATYQVGSASRSLNKGTLQYFYDITDLGDIYGNFQGENAQNTAPYYNSQIQFTMHIDGADENPVTVSPVIINMGDRPNGAWMKPYDVTISSNVESVNVTSITSSNSYFNIANAETPVEIAFGEPLTVQLSHSTGNGNITGQLTVNYDGSKGSKVVEMSAMAYTPVMPDVWEMPEVVTLYPHLSTPTFTDLHHNYKLPFGGTNGVDAVYKITFTSDNVLTATATGNDAKVVLYPEDFGGKGGPDVDNYFSSQTSAVISNMLVPAGTYYLVASATSSFMVFLDAENTPEPSKPYNPSPVNMATGVTNSTLSWQLSDNTTEYQLLFDTQNPPQNVAVNWTNNIQTSYNAGSLSNSTRYYWQVNARNTSGTATGDVWSFSTPFEVPDGLYAVINTIYEGDAAVLHWYPIEGSCDGYNIYSNGVKMNDALITEPTYTLNGLTYNMSGYDITVTAVYDDVESDHSDDVRVYVSGKGTVTGKILEIDEATPISEGSILFEGKDEFQSTSTLTLNVNSDGSYSGDIYAGNYTVKVYVDGYQNISTQIDVAYGQTVNMDFVMYENYYPVSEVVATEIDETSVKVEWEMNRELSGYNIYRRNFHNDDAQLIAEDITTSTYTDDKWSDVELGAYQWGVAAVYEGNRIEKVIFKQDFEKGVMPQGWTIFEEPESEYYISDWEVKKESYGYYPFNGTYAAFSTGSSSSSTYYMVTDAIDLSICRDVELRFHYITPDWDGSVNKLMVKVSTSPTGPWTEIWSSNMTDASQWTEVSVDLSDYADKTTYIAFANENHYGYCSAIDNIFIIDHSTESEIVWSNKVDKGMSTIMTVTAETNNGDPVTGTTVYFSNIGEGSYNYNVTLDETGTYTWNDFRKGKYELTIAKNGYSSNYDGVIVDIWEETEIECLLTEILASVENLYVSPTGWVRWDAFESKELLSYDIKLNGIFQDQVTTPYYQHDIDAFAFEEGEVYTTTVITNYTSGSSAAVKYTWTFSECDNFEGPIDFSVETVDGNNILSWEMPEVDHPNEYDGKWMYYDDGINVDGVGRYSGGSFYWGIMFTSADLKPYVGQSLVRVSTFDYAAHDGDILIYTGGDTAPLNLVHSQSYSCYGSKEYIEFELTESVLIGDANIWIVFYNHNGKYIAPAGANTGNPNGRWISEDGSEWLDMYLDVEWDYTWNIRVFANYDGDYPGMEKEIIGMMVYRDGELITPEPITEDTFSDNASENAEYQVRIVHGGLPNVSYYAMSCLTNVISVEENIDDNTAIYPNPVKDNLYIAAEAMKQIVVTNTLGQVVYDIEVDSDNEMIDMSQYEDGIYMVRIITENGTSVRKIVKF